ncbi:hypothetical protein GQ457_04G014220 [Hibiscus cannabinus]
MLNFLYVTASLHPNEYVKQVVQEDNAGNYSEAFEYFRTHLKYKKNSKIREAITHKFTEYLRRVEEIHVVLDKGESAKHALQEVVILNVKFLQFFYKLCKKLGW